MLNLIGWLLKITLFATAVLVIGNWVRVGDRTVSDQIKTQLSHAERSPWGETLKGWTDSVTQEGIPHRPRHHPTAAPGPSHERRHLDEMRAEDQNPEERVSPTERQKLRALIQELNTTGTASARN